MGPLGMGDSRIDLVTATRNPHYEPFGWHHWPEHPWMSYQFRRALGETQEGAGTISECFLAASRMTPGDRESWHHEWLRVAEQADRQAHDALKAGHRVTARRRWQSAANYFRSAEFWLDPGDPRRLVTFSRCEACFERAIGLFHPPGERVKIPYEDASLAAYFLPPITGQPPYPTLIAFGGLDSFKDELYFMVGRGMLERGIACLLVDGPGQGATLRRQSIVNRPDYEVPVGKCVDYLLTRKDVDASRIAVSGTSLGGYYAARAASFEHRLAAAISHGAMWDVSEFWAGRDENYGLAGHIKWSFGRPSMEDALEKAREFALDGVLDHMRCPYLIVHGGDDVLGVTHASHVYEYAKSKGLNVTLKLFSADETGAEHCQHDNPTVGMNFMADWLADQFSAS